MSYTEVYGSVILNSHTCTCTYIDTVLMYMYIHDLTDWTGCIWV